MRIAHFQEKVEQTPGLWESELYRWSYV